ncbi:hypothetical protein BCV69DRAFT_300822 [Microstroma glucosiphilum]|uniref:MI domain-containing protein n=1 Tax=Pseudomicrostroma glucosiphilum TaxID=1684307 RepID=A0A316U0W5_9BASI|nr:hypothetical protein BCV69DRAFT_300822 [Pseudomicrostroma glucosiphilum]PWN19042.1 hypothetical protein BCV69DRAFT_300822 [Pseudomicrostroma glucosiphilum]
MPSFKQGRGRGQSRKDPRTTRLPALLRDELGLPGPAARDAGAQSQGRGRGGGGGGFSRGGRGGRFDGRGGRGGGRPLGRTETRKLERQEKKSAKGQHAAHSTQPRRQDPYGSNHSSGRPLNGSTQINKGKRRQYDDDDDDEGSDEEDVTSSSEEEQTRSREPPKSKKQRVDASSSSSSSVTATNGSDPSKQRRNVASDEKTPLQRLLDKSSATSSRPPPSRSRSSSKRIRGAPLTQQEKEEEQEIAWLEAMLGRGKKEKSGKGKRGDDDEEETAGQDEDGLDALLGELDRFYPGMYEEGDDDDDEDESDEEESEGEDEELSTGDDEDQSDEEESDEEEEEDFAGFSEEEEDSEEGSEAALEGQAVPSPDAEVPSPQSAVNGTASSTETSLKPATGRYIPPAARAAAAAAAASSAASSSSSALPTSNPNLPRQLQGLLNRLGDSNLDPILTSIEGIYSANPRAEVSQTLTKLILDTIAARSNLLLTDTFVVIQAGLVAGLVKVVGIEFAAGLIQDLVGRVSQYYRDALNGQQGAANGSGANEPAEVGKEMTNLVTLLAHLYNLQVVACPLIYDLIKLFLGSGSSSTIRKPNTNAMTELDVELLLKLVKTCGPQLRSDDASSLKSIVTLATEQCAKSTSSSSTRTRFMLETLNDLKNNRAKAAAAQANDASTQLLGQLKKYLAGMEKKRTVKGREALRVVLRDLEEAGERGKWWLVGAGWKGQEGDLVGEESSTALGGEARGVTAKSRLRRIGEVEDEAEDDLTSSGSGSGSQAALLALARQHGMNTPSRRQIFSTLLTSTDYLSSSQCLLTLKLSDTQRREIVRVLLHVLEREEVYNPFYSLVGVELAKRDAGVKVTMQFCLWDYLRSIGEKRVGGRSVIANQDEDDEDDEGAFGDEGEGGEEEGRKGELARQKMWHLARCYGWWIAKGALGLNVLRTISFSTLKPRSTHFLHLLMVHLLLSTQTNSPSLTLPRRKTKSSDRRSGSGSKKSNSGQAEAEEEGAGDPHALRNLFRPSLLRNPDLVVGLAWFFQQWSSSTSTSTSTSTSSATSTSARSGTSKSRKGGKDKDSLKELVGEDEVVYARLKWAIGVVRETLATDGGGAGGGGAAGRGGGGEVEDEEEEEDRRGGRDWR